MNDKAAKAPARARRNAQYSGRMVREICDRLAAGGTLFGISRQAGMPSHATLYNWLKRRPGFAEAVAAAKAAGADYCLDRALEVACGSTKETVSRDRLEVSAWEKRADRIEASAAKDARDPRAEPVQVIFYARQFEKVVGPDGRAYVREVEVEDEA